MKKSSNTGFTLVETLVAIAILMIAVAGPLSIASKGLTAALYARDQMIATFLAQESMEVVKNTKDNNLSNSLGWLTSFSGCTSSAPCDASEIDSPAIIPINQCAASSGPVGCQLYTETDGYGHTSFSAQPTSFKRFFYITPITSNLGSSQEAQVSVVVRWSEGTVPNEVDLTGEILNTHR